MFRYSMMSGMVYGMVRYGMKGKRYRSTIEVQAELKKCRLLLESTTETAELFLSESVWVFSCKETSASSTRVLIQVTHTCLLNY